MNTAVYASDTRDSRHSYVYTVTHISDGAVCIRHDATAGKVAFSCAVRSICSRILCAKKTKEVKLNLSSFNN